MAYNVNSFCVGFPTPCYRVRTLFVAESKAFVTWFLLTTWREDWVPLAKIFSEKEA